MYDNVKMQFYKNQDTPAVFQNLENVFEKVDRQTGALSYSGNLGTLSVTETARAIYLSGSLSKYLHGDNVFALDRHATQTAIEKISDNLHLDVSGANVSAFEFGAVFPMKYQVNEYLTRLGAIRGKLPADYNGTKYYDLSKYLQFYFYDKIKEMKEKHRTPPPHLQNLLKYEIRVKNAKRVFKCNITAEMLADKEIYKSFLELYKELYFRIKKMNIEVMDFSKNERNTPKSVLDAFLGDLLQKCDNDTINAFLLNVRAQNVFDKPKYYTELKKRLFELQTARHATQKDDRVKELDDCVQNATVYF